MRSQTKTWVIVATTISLIAAMLGITSVAGAAGVPITTVEQFVDTHYDVLLDDQTPDASGRAYWSSTVRTNGDGCPANLPLLSTWMANTPEGQTDVLTKTTPEIVEMLYQIFLGRAADDTGLAYWSGIYDTDGMAVVAENLLISVESRVDIAAVCASVPPPTSTTTTTAPSTTSTTATSTTTSTTTAPTTTSTSTTSTSTTTTVAPPSTVTADQFIEDIYVGLRGAGSDAAGLQYWTGVILQARSSTDCEIVSKRIPTFFLDGAEGINTIAANEATPYALMDIIYRMYLGRPSDDAGATYWVEEVLNVRGPGETFADRVDIVQAAFEVSDENDNRITAMCAGRSTPWPSVTGFTANNGAAVTTTRAVTLSSSLINADPLEMQTPYQKKYQATQRQPSLTAETDAAALSNYVTSIPFTVTGSSGCKNVRFAARDSAGRVTDTVSDKIGLNSMTTSLPHQRISSRPEHGESELDPAPASNSFATCKVANAPLQLGRS